MVRAVVGGGVGHFLRIKHDDVRPESFLDQAAVFKAERVRGQAGHSADGVFEAQGFEFADVSAQDVGVVAVASRMGNVLAELAQAAVAGDHDVGMLHELLEVGFIDSVEDAACAAVHFNLQNHFDLVIARIQATHFLCGFDDVESVEGFVVLV